MTNKNWSRTEALWRVGGFLVWGSPIKRMADGFALAGYARCVYGTWSQAIVGLQKVYAHFRFKV